MKRIIFYIISLTSILNAQNGLTQQEINDFYITPLDSTDNLQSTIEGIINLNLVEALPKIEENFWKQSCMNQEWFLEAMFKFNSKLTHDYCLRYLDSINNSTSKKYKYYMCGDTLSTKVEVISILYKLKDYSRVDEVFRLLDRDKEEGSDYSNAVLLLPYIYKNRIEHKERAKKEMISALNSTDDDYSIFAYSLTLTQAFEEEEVPEMLQIFKNIQNPQAKRAMLQFYFSKYSNKFDLEGLVKETLVSEPNSELRLYLVKVLLLGFAEPSDYKFVKEYLQSEPNDTINSLINYEIDTFEPRPPDSIKSSQSMLNELIDLVDTAYHYDWLGNLEFKNELQSILQSAKNILENGDSSNCAKNVKAFQDSVNIVYSDSLNSNPQFVAEEGWKFLYYNAQYILDKLPAIPEETTANLTVKLTNSTGSLLTGGSLQYYEGAWKDAINNGDGTFAVNTDKQSLSLRMTYEYGTQTVSNVPAQNNTFTFQTVNTVVQLKNSQGNLINEEGTVKYYAGAWRDFGTTINGVATKELLPNNYSFRMTYAYGSNDKQQDIGTNSTVVFQTVNANVQLQNSSGTLIDEGTATSGAGQVKYYAGAWRDFGTTVNGVAAKELLPNNYSFRMTYAYASNDKQQDIGTNPTVVFQTVNANVQLKNSAGTLIDEGTVKYYAGAWRDFGTTSNGVAAKELLPNNYSFRMTYAYGSNDKQQDIGTNSTVVFQTVNANVQLKNSSGTLIPAPMGDEGIVKYYAGAWRDFGTTVNGVAAKELLPNNYSFRMTYEYVSNDKQPRLVGGTNNTVTFSTVLCTVKVNDSQNQPINNVDVKYYAGAWRNFGTTVNGEAVKELLPANITFRASAGGVSRDKQQNIGDNSIVEIILQ